MRNSLLLFLLLLKLSVYSVYSSDSLTPIEIQYGTDEYVLDNAKFMVLEDQSNSLEISDILNDSNQRKFQLYQPNSGVPYSNEHYQSTYWLKFQIKNKSTIDEWYILESYAPHTENLSLFIPNSDGEYLEKMSGLNHYFYERVYINKNLVFDLPVRPGQTKTFYIKIHSPKYWSGFDFRIKPIRKWTSYSTTEYFFLGLFYGILLIMAAYNLLLYFTLREKVYFQFVLYIIVGILVTSFEDGLGHQFIWYNVRSLFSTLGLYIFPLALTVLFVLYSRTFLELKFRNQKADKTILVITVAFIGYHILHHLLKLFWPTLPYFRIINTLPYLYILYISIKSYRNNFRPARYFMIGSAFIALSMITIQLRANGLINGNLFTVYLLNYGLVTDILFFSLALSERIKFIKQNEQIAQLKIIEQLEENATLRTKVNRELEEKVQEKTKELAQQMDLLNESNEKLSFAVEELKSMNINLDLDNWKLKKTIKKTTELRLNDEELSFVGFSELFPDKLSCLKKISQLKWGEDGNTYECKKCKNKNASKGPQSYSKKCTKCNYTETATAYTLFHGVRFPLNKAVYLTYLVSRNEKKTIEQLSEEIDLRMNTCWSFKKKIISKKETVKQQLKVPHITHWEQLVLD